MPDVEEYDKEQLLAFEKEVLGVYISGHPLEKYEKMWQKNISATTMDFAYQEELHGSRLLTEQRRSSEAWSKALRSSIQKQ